MLKLAQCWLLEDHFWEILAKFSSNRLKVTFISGKSEKSILSVWCLLVACLILLRNPIARRTLVRWPTRGVHEWWHCHHWDVRVIGLLNLSHWGQMSTDTFSIQKLSCIEFWMITFFERQSHYFWSSHMVSAGRSMAVCAKVMKGGPVDDGQGKAKPCESSDLFFLWRRMTRQHALDLFSSLRPRDSLCWWVGLVDRLKQLRWYAVTFEFASSIPIKVCRHCIHYRVIARKYERRRRVFVLLLGGGSGSCLVSRLQITVTRGWSEHSTTRAR